MLSLKYIFLPIIQQPKKIGFPLSCNSYFYHVEILFFKNAEEWRAWLHKNHNTRTECYVGFYKKGAPHKGIGYKEAIDEALCYGWIDGIVKRVDEHSYMHRFTPRTAKSIWSAVNIKRIVELTALKRMHPAGLKTFNERDPTRMGLYSFEQKSIIMDAAYEKVLKKNKKAWTYFEAQPPGYKRLVTHWVTSAKREETRLKRLNELIESCSQGIRLAQFVSGKQ